MKRPALFLALTQLVVIPAFGQASFNAPKTNIPPGWIDGATSPNSVPDRVAYRLVFVHLMLPASPDQAAISRQENRIRRIGLSSADAATLKQALVAFATSYSTRNATPGATNVQVSAIVQSTRSSLQSQLTPDGSSKLSAFVALEKRRMLVGPNN